MIGFFNNKIVALIILGTIIAGTAAGVVLVRQQQILKSRAAYTDTGTTCDNGRKVGEFWPGVCDKSGKRIYMACNSDLTISRAFVEEDSTCAAQANPARGNVGVAVDNTATTCSNGTKKVGDPAWPECRGCAEGTVSCIGQDQYSEFKVVNSNSSNCGANCGGGEAETADQSTNKKVGGSPDGIRAASNACIIPMANFPKSSSCNPIPNGCPTSAYYWEIIAPGTNKAPSVDAKFNGPDNVLKNACSSHSDCPKNDSDSLNVNADTSNWCYEFTEGNRCIQLKHVPDAPSCGTGGPNNTANNTCSNNIGSQTPDLGVECASCIASNNRGITGAIRDLNSNLFTSCSDREVINYWCNGGVSSDGVNQCNSSKNGACASKCGGSSSSGNPLPAAQNLQAKCLFEGDNLVNPTYVNYTVNQTRGVGGARPTSLTQKYSLSGTVSGDGFLDVGEWTKDNVWVRAFRPGEEISISSPTNWLQVGYNVRFGNVTFSNTKFVEVLPADKPRVKATWNPIPESVAYVVRVNADPWDPWSPVDLGTYNGTLHIAPEIGSRDFGANTQGNTSTAYEAQVVQGLKYNLSIQGVRQGEAYPYKGQYAGVDFTCSPATPSVPPSVPPSTPPIATVAYRIAESPADLNSAAWQTYTAAGMTIDYDFQTPGDKFIFVQFKDSAGNVTNSTNCPKCQNQIRVLGENPAIASCSLSFDKNKTFINLTGKNFGSVKGKAKSEETELEIKQWKNENVVLVWTDAPSGQSLPVTLTNTDGQVAEGSCSAISQLSVGAKVFCRQPSQHKTDNVDMVLVGAFEGGKKTSQKVSIDKDGVIQGLNQKLEAGKAYRISLKAPKSLRRTSKPFIAQEGTTTVPDFVLPVGDIFPADGGDGKINTADYSTLIRQWNIADNASGRSADFNQDGRVNAVDYACMRVSMPAAVSGNDPEPEPGPVVSSRAPAGQGETCGGIAGIRCISGYQCQITLEEGLTSRMRVELVWQRV